MALATDAHGNELVEVSLDGSSPPSTDRVPLTGALAVVVGTDGVLLVHDVWRDQWELPGGGIEDGETAEQAVRREVREESGQLLRLSEQAGWAVFRLASSARIERADLFCGEVDTVRDFEPGAETDGIRWWDEVTAPEGVGAIDRELIRRIRSDRRHAR